jgi:biofilm PGA synthesis N-glycosyltransferase PgaC
LSVPSCHASLPNYPIGQSSARRESATVEPVSRDTNLTVVAAVVFLNERKLLPRLLSSLERQTRAPDLLLLVDDGSDDGSDEIATALVVRCPYARLVTRPWRAPSADRLADAAELVAFQDAVGPFASSYDVIAKLDADLDLPPRFFETIMREFEADATIGIAGTPLAVPSESGATAEHSQPWHVRGATKFYRAACWRSIEPLPAILGWDTIDETRARINGWSVRSVPLQGEMPLHLRPTGSHDGSLRGFRRRGAAAWGYGAHPLHVLASGFIRMRHRPLVRGGAAYLAGWVTAAARRAPRAEPEARAHLRREQLQRLQTAFRGGAE